MVDSGSRTPDSLEGSSDGRIHPRRQASKEFAKPVPARVSSHAKQEPRPDITPALAPYHHGGTNHAKVPLPPPADPTSAGGFVFGAICVGMVARYPSRMTRLACLLGLSLLAACTSMTASHSTTPSPSPAADRAAWHAARLDALRAPDGWLTLVGLDFLELGTSTIGAAPSSTLCYEHCTAATIGALEVTADTVRFHAAPSVLCTLEHATADGVLHTDESGAPSVIRNGTLSFTLVRRNGQRALRVRDSASATRAHFQGIPLFDYNPVWAVEAAVVAPTPGQMVAITNVRGFVEEQPVAAQLTFTVAGVPHTLTATKGSAGTLFVVFGDKTNGALTYGGGRFLEVPAPRNGLTTLDFNRAINPPCSFTPFATCPLPPVENQLPAAVRAGERSTPHPEISRDR